MRASQLTRREWFGTTATALGIAACKGLFPLPLAGSTEGGVSSSGEQLFREHFQVCVPQQGIGRYDREELALAERIITSNVSQLLSTVVSALGAESLRSRLADVARNNPLSEDRIPIVYVPHPEHPHNMLDGIPYTGVYVGRMPQLPVVVAHETAHVIFGKFNNGLAEPIANLFVDRNGDHVDRHSLPSRHDRMPTSNQAIANSPLRLNQMVTLAALELFDEGIRLANLSSLADLFSHRPLYRLVAERRYEYHKQRRETGRDPAQATQEFLRLLLASEYHQSLRQHASLDIEQPLGDVQREIEAWLREYASDAFAAHASNPSESRGANVRDLVGLLDTTLMDFLLEKGLDTGQAAETCTPEAARRSLRKVLQFYYAPRASLPLFGYQGFDELEEGVRRYLGNLGGLSLRREFAWYQLKDDLRGSLCYQPASWNHPDCRAEGRGFDPGTPVWKFMRSLSNPPAPPRRGLHPVVAATLVEPTGRPLISLTDNLGSNLDFETYFSLP